MSWAMTGAVMQLLVKSTPLAALDAVAFDTETTALDAKNARVVQFGAVELKALALAGGAPFDTRVNPGLPIPPRSTEVHGLSDADVATAPAFREAYAAFRAFAGDRPLIGHAVDYDAAVIAAECARHGLKWRPPLMLDTRVLARIAAPGLPNYSLEFLCEWLGAPPVKRHDAVEDARACAEIFVRLAPRLREKGVATFGQALAASQTFNDRAAQADPGRAHPISPLAPASEGEPLARLDYHPYSRRVKEAMTAPPLFADGSLTLGAAAQRMLDEWVSALLVDDDGRLGIITERDILRAFAAQGPEVKSRPIAEFMSAPLETVRADDFLYRALGRIDRLGIRHLPVADAAGEIVGVVTPRNLLKRPMTAAFDLGDEIHTARDVAALAIAKAKMTPLARSLLAEGLDARGVAAVISEELLALTGRAAAIAAERLAAEGRGGPPASYAVLVLGSAGRGESLLSADQDNAIVFADDADEAAADAWLAALGGHVADILDEIGVPYCKGGVMAKNAAWRRNETGWRRTIDGWVRRSNPQDLLNIDIFFDATIAHGDRAMFERLHDHAFERARSSPMFLKLLAELASDWRPPIGFFGSLRKDERGRLDLKKGGLMPLFTAVRMLALKHGIDARSTPSRLLALHGREPGMDAEIDAAVEAQGLMLDRILRQQIADAEAGAPLGPRIEVAALSGEERTRLKRAIRAVSPIVAMAREGRF
jgi:DNA polymerase-3 subunit epsilon/CBS domain-containing protein